MTEITISVGRQGACGTVTIGGKVVGTISESPFVYKP